MLRIRTPRLTTSLVSRATACQRLGIGRNTFWRHWHNVFTDPRSPENRRDGVNRRVYEDELAIAVEAGGHEGKGRLAVLNYRGAINRTEST